jgi:hypothetical protein
MGNFSDWLTLLALIALVAGSRSIVDLAHHLGGRGGGPPTHPLPVTSQIETSRPAKNTDKI